MAFGRQCGLVIGHVRHGRVTVGYPVADRGPGMNHHRTATPEPADLELVHRRVVELESRRDVAQPDGEERRRQIPREARAEVESRRRRTPDVDLEVLLE